MARNLWRRLTFEVTIRVAADLLIVNVSYLAALLIRMLWDFAAENGTPTRNQLVDVFATFGASSWLLSFISTATFSVSGFYSRGRLYQSRFKALAIFQGVTTSYI